MPVEHFCSAAAVHLLAALDSRGRKPQPAAASLFEWALTVEQEREEEPVGAGR